MERAVSLKTAFLAFVVIALAFPAVAGSDPVTISSFSRLAIATASSGGGTSDGDVKQNADVLSVAAASQSGLNSATGSGTLISGVSDDGHTFFGSGALASAVNALENPASGHAETSYDVQFQIVQSHRWNLLANFLSTGSESDRNEAEWAVRGHFMPVRSESPTFVRFDGSDSTSIAASGVLDPGTYRFGVGTRTTSFRPAGGGAAASSLEFGFSFTLSNADDAAPIPEPGTLLLLGSGLVGLLHVRHRRQEK